MVVELSKRSSAEKFIDEINITNSKKVAVVFVLGFIAYHGILHLQYGPDSCSWLLSDGRYKGDHEWQPYGCMLHRYSQTDTRHCFRYLAFWGRYNHFAFIGDFRIQQLYHFFVSHIKVQQDGESASLHPRSNSTFVDSKLRLSAEFIWSPYVSSKMVQQFRDWERSSSPPSVVVAGCGPTIIREQNASLAALAQYRTNLSRLVQPARGLAQRGGSTLWVLQEPVEAERLSAGLQLLTQQQLDLYNEAAVEMLTHSSVKLWGSSRLVVGGAMSEDGLSLSPTALRHDTQILLNMYCNDHMNFDDGTCCSSPEPCTTLQIVTFSIFLVCMVLVGVMTVYRRLEEWRRGREYRAVGPPTESEGTGGPRQVLGALAILGLILAYFYLCDRTNFFMKENKYYSEWSFWLPVGYVLVLGLFFTEEARSPRVLHREQTAEWRGWMQLLVLGAQVTGAARLLPNHMLLRALASAYLFLSGYGHFCYVWHTGDAGLVRVLRVLFRLNFMTVVLCLTMNRPYQFYQFVPLLSFWVVLLYSALALPPLVTAHTSEGHPYRYSYLALKFLGLFAVITVLYMSEVFFEKVFVTRPWKALFVTTDDDIQQWWERWKSDRYSLWAGAVFAACFRLAQRHQLLDDSSHANLLAPRPAVAAALAALAVLGGWLALPLLCGGWRQCEEVHSYVGALPVVAYIALRNLSGALRARYSSFLAWFGDISLELFVCQHHIWLAADTHGVLVLVPGMPNLNLLLTSFIFVCAAHEVRRLTRLLQPVVVPADLRTCVRNLVIFIVILVPIGIHDGMF